MLRMIGFAEVKIQCPVYDSAFVKQCSLIDARSITDNILCTVTCEREDHYGSTGHVANAHFAQRNRPESFAAGQFSMGSPVARAR